jgi:hypothetical protein
MAICEAHSRENMVAVSGCVWCDLETALTQQQRMRLVLERIMDVADRYQENDTSTACAGLANCYRFAKAALGK